MIIPSDDEFLDVGAVVVRNDESIDPACASGAPFRRQVRSMDERITVEWPQISRNVSTQHEVE